MKTRVYFSALVFLLIMTLPAYAGQFVSGSTGADGAFNPTQDVQLQIPPDGVFNFTTVNIPQGVTVTFKKNEANTPVYILATGDVTIAGKIIVNGSPGTGVTPGKGGPGGFDGGYGGMQGQVGGKGQGPGGGYPGKIYYSKGTGGGGGGFGAQGSNSSYYDNNYSKGGNIYGNKELLPLIGGSGGGGGAGSTNGTGGAGGGGGGAILIASSGTINITGEIHADGGRGANAGTFAGSGGGGSGGAIKLIANVIKGNGTISANGGTYGSGYYTNGQGAPGRIRLEAHTIERTAGTSPGYTYGFPPASVFPPSIPSLKIVSINGAQVPQSPKGSYETPDVILPAGTQNPVTVVIEATNIPVGTVVDVTVMPQFGAATTVQSTALSGTDQSSTATADINISASYPSVIMATATFTVQTAMYYEGEKIEKVKVATRAGGNSEAVYITESGKQIKPAQLMAKALWRR